MAARIQGKLLGLGKAKQSDIATASASFIRFRQLNAAVTSGIFGTETDKDEVGKGDEFISQVYPVAFDIGARIDKFSSAEFMTWALCYTLGSVVEASSTYTITPIDPGTTLELPYFTVVEQIPEGGGSAIDNAYIGCAVEEFLYEFNYGPGRQSGRVTVTWVGSGKITSPSTITLPAVQSESHMLTASMALTINGTNYVSAKTILSGAIGWKNNLMAGAGFFPGSGTQNGAAIRGRLEIGSRQPSFTFSARLLATSDEYTKLVAQTTGTAVLTVTFDATHTVTFTFHSISYEVVEHGEVDGLIAVSVTLAVKKHSTNGVLTVTAKCGIAGIAQ